MLFMCLLYRVVIAIIDGYLINIKVYVMAVADPEGVHGVCSNPPFRPNYLIFKGIFQKNRANDPKLTNQTPTVNLHTLSSGPVWRNRNSQLAAKDKFP